jgi:hypothetical protein
MRKTMPLYLPPWDTDNEPNEGNIKQWMDNFYSKFEPMEQARWNQANIDTLFYAGEQRFINSYFNFNPTGSFNNFHFNIMQQPINMVTGYQRQHRKSINYLPIEGSKQEHADDLTKLITYANNYRGILEKFSTACEQSAIGGTVWIQPYLDFIDDPVNGTLDLKVWSYNSWMSDCYWREPDASDMNVWWGQQYVSKQEAMSKFPKKAELIRNLSGMGNRYGKFYFLPENYNLARHDLLVLSHIWYKSKRRKEVLYNHNDGISYDYAGEDVGELIRDTGFFELITIDQPTWKLAVVVNEQLMYLGKNPLNFDSTPVIPIYWNRDPHMAQYDLRDRSLARAMRDSQFLLNRRIILNHSISECSINGGYKRKENAVANEEVLKKTGEGYDIIIKEGFEMTDLEKLIPTAVPPADMELATQMSDFIFKTSGVNLENFGIGDNSDKIQSGLAIMLKQGAGLMVLQKYFDQWDTALKLLGKLEQTIIQTHWSPAKVARIIGKEPSPEFKAKTFSKYDVTVAEGLNTSVQQQQQFMQMLELNRELGGIIPKKFILLHATIQGKDEIMKAVDEQEKQAAMMAQEQMKIEHAKLEAELGYIQSKSFNEIQSGRERSARSDSNEGLFEERVSEITQNRSMALKNKVEALAKLLELTTMYGQSEANDKAKQIQGENLLQKQNESEEQMIGRLLSREGENTNMQKQPQDLGQQARSALL